MINNKAIGEKVRQLRARMGLTTVTLARKVGMSQAQVSRLENGLQGFRSATLIKFCRILGVDPVYVFVGDDAASVGKVTRELKRRGLQPTRTLQKALANAAFLRFAERCAKAFHSGKQKLPQMDKLIRQRF
jgi:transcriptional regulator with XRE-family HTH domain